MGQGKLSFPTLTTPEYQSNRVSCASCGHLLQGCSGRAELHIPSSLFPAHPWRKSRCMRVEGGCVFFCWKSFYRVLLVYPREGSLCALSFLLKNWHCTCLQSLDGRGGSPSEQIFIEIPSFPCSTFTLLHLNSPTWTLLDSCEGRFLSWCLC